MYLFILEKHAPVRNSRVPENLCPWLTKELKQLSVIRDRLKKQPMNFKSNILMKAYRQTYNKVNKLNIELQREFFRNKIASQNGDLKIAWKTINTVRNESQKPHRLLHLIDGSLFSDSKSIAEPLNNFFHSIGDTLSSKIPETPNPLWENEYSVKPQDLKIGLPVIIESLCDIFNLSVVTGVFPDSLKSARDAPIFESGQINDQSIIID